MQFTENYCDKYDFIQFTDSVWTFGSFGNAMKSSNLLSTPTKMSIRVMMDCFISRLNSE